MTDDSAARSPWTAHLVAPVLLLALTALLYLPGTGAIPLMDRDEPRFAHATVEMMQRDTWLVPYFNGEYRFDKPPLTYWWMRLHYLVFGINELAARLHSVVAVWLVSLVVFAMGRRLSASRAAAWWGAIGWLTSFQALVHGRLCVADMPMVLCVALAMWSLLELLTADAAPLRYGRWWWTLWLSLGAGFLAKGPIALLVPALALVLWRFALWRKPVPWSGLQIAWGVLLAFAPVAAWGIPALMETQGLFWKVGMGEHVVKRGTQAFNGRVIIPGYYLLSAFLSLLPWVAFLPPTVAYVRRNWSARLALLVAWFAAPQIIFLLYATQLPHYTMPGFPAFFVVLGLAMSAAPQRVSGFAKCFLGFFILLGLVLVAFVWSGIIPMPSAFQKLITCVAVILVAMSAVGVAGLRRWKGGVVAACLALAGALMVLGQGLRDMHPVVQLSSTLRTLPEKAALVACGYTEPGLVFYADREWTMLSRLERVKERIAKQRADAVVLLVREWTLSDWIKKSGWKHAPTPTKDFTSEIDALAAEAESYTVQNVSGLNLARSSWVELRLLVRK